MSRFWRSVPASILAIMLPFAIGAALVLLYSWHVPVLPSGDQHKAKREETPHAWRVRQLPDGSAVVEPNPRHTGPNCEECKLIREGRLPLRERPEPKN